MSLFQNYPKEAPYITCLTDIAFPTINDQRNLLPCLIEEWKSNSRIAKIIFNMPVFIKLYKTDTVNYLLDYYGYYMINSYKYSINDFICNKTTKVQKVQILYNYNELEDFYFVLTDVSVIIMSIDKYDKSKCLVVFYSEITLIESILRAKLNPDKSEYKEKAGLIFQWNSRAKATFNNIILIKQVGNKQFQDDIMQRKNALSHQYTLYSTNGQNDLLTMTKIAQIKEQFLSKSDDHYTFNCLVKLYQQIIEMYSTMNDKGYLSYFEKLSNLYKKYDSFILTKKSK